MTIDKSKWDYLTVGPANVVAEVPLGTDPADFTHKVTSTSLASLAEAYAKARPSHTVVCRGFLNHNPLGLTVHTCAIYAGKEQLGRVHYGYVSRGSTGRGFNINCPSLDAKRVRGSATSTEDEKRALKIMLSSFKQTSTAELVNASFHKAIAVVQGAHTNALIKYQRHHEPVQLALSRKFKADPERVLADLVANHALAPDEAAAVLEITPTIKAINHMNAARDSSTGTACVVYLMGDSYYVRPAKDDAPTEHFVSDTLPASLRSAVGLLKMVSDGTIVPDVGVRVDEDTLYVLRQEGGDQ